MAEPATHADRTKAHRLAIDPIGEGLAAVAFLTRIPVRSASYERERTGAAAFGLVGLAIGLAAAAPLLLLTPQLSMAAAVLAMVVLAIATGGLHLDGLADTADALAAPTPAASERARTDPSAGPAGVATVSLVLLLQASLLAAIAAADALTAAAAIVAAAAGSRAAAPFAAWVGKRAGAAGGRLGGWFADRVRLGDVLVADVTAVLVAGGAGIVTGRWEVPAGFALGGAAGAIASAIVIRSRGRLDGDGYGAIVEVVFASMLLGVAVLVVGR